MTESFEFEALCSLDFERCLFSGQVFRWARVGRCGYRGVDEDRWYEIEDHGNRVLVQTNGSEGDFSKLFRLDADIAKIERQILVATPELEGSVNAVRGLRMMRPADPVEVFYSFLCTANNNLKRIMPMVDGLAAYGELLWPKPPDCRTELRRFPSSEVIASIPEADLRSKGFGYRGATIPYAAQEVMRRGGDEWIAGLRAIGYERAHEELVSIKGIGHKLADCICLYGLHYDEAVPIDTHLWQAACRIFFPQHFGMALTERRYRQVGDFFRDRFGNLAGWAHLYLYYHDMTRRAR